MKDDLPIFNRFFKNQHENNNSNNVLPKQIKTTQSAKWKPDGTQVVTVDSNLSKLSFGPWQQGTKDSQQATNEPSWKSVISSFWRSDSKKNLRNKSNSIEKKIANDLQLIHNDKVPQLTQLGLYEIGKSIGVGTFSKVKLGRNKITKEHVAVKIILKNEAKKGFSTARIYQEINVQKKANHKRVCQILNVFDTGDQVAIVLEYAPTDLLQYINSQPKKFLPEVEVRRLFTQIVEGLDFLHEIHVIHRDLKPQNILLDKHMNVKIADFSFGKCSKAFFFSTVCGSSVYAAPELVRQKHYIGKVADIWSIGVILYNMLFGKMPFKAYANAVKTRARHVLYDVDIPEMELQINLEIPSRLVSSSVAHLLCHVIVINPERRYTMDRIKGHKWMTGLPSSSLSTTRSLTKGRAIAKSCENVSTTY